MKHSLVPAIGIGLALGGAIPVDAFAAIKLCNGTNNAVEYSMVWDEGIPVFAPIWKTAGWYRMQPGNCKTVLRGNVRQELYLSIRRLTRSGPVLTVYKLDERDYYTKGMYGIEDQFCVKHGDRKFSRTVKKLTELRQCPAQWYRQTYNLMGFTTVGTRLTMRIK